MSHQKKVFVSWSGSAGRRLAVGLKETVLSHPALNVFVSAVDIELGSPWFESINKALEGADFGLACLVPGASSMPWVNFEAGFIFGRLKNFKLFLFGETLHGPLDHLQAVHGTDRSNILRLLMDLTGDNEKQADRWYNSVEADWKAVYEEVTNESEGPEIDKTVGRLIRAGSKVRNNNVFRRNRCFQKLLLASLKVTAESLVEVENYYSIPAERYPYYLIHLQEEHQVDVSAIAVVGRDEHFWQQEVGRQVLQTSDRGRTRRVFVFWRSEGLFEHFDILMQHAQRYDTWVMSLDQLNREFPGQTNDFSVISLGGDQVAAQYEQRGNLKFIRFSAAQQEVEQRRRTIEAILKRAHPLDPKVAFSPNILANSVFNTRSLQPLETRPVEMSGYISISSYDEHEEKHAYYPEMLQLMVDAVRERSEQQGEPLEVLEVGAGTGLLTRRLVKLPMVNIIALEIDWLCFHRMKEVLSREVNEAQRHRIQFLNEDSRTFDPEGDFDVICSSFADHHIKLGDKMEYFQNIRRNLRSDGLFLVGDEFLRDHDLNDVTERHAALLAYHNHIISIAEVAGHSELADLEREALRSGIEERGDFKVSCSFFENLLQQAGFIFEKRPVGPPSGRDEIGGIYVYLCRHVPEGLRI